MQRLRKQAQIYDSNEPYPKDYRVNTVVFFVYLKLHLAWSYVRCSFKESNRRSNHMKERDVRTFCYPCFVDYFNAGYKMEKLNKPKSRCDKCNRQGCTYWLKSNRRR